MRPARMVGTINPLRHQGLKRGNYVPLHSGGILDNLSREVKGATFPLSKEVKGATFPLSKDVKGATFPFLDRHSHCSVRLGSLSQEVA